MINSVRLTCILTRDRKYSVNDRTNISVFRAKISNKGSNYFWIIAHRDLADQIKSFTTGTQFDIEGELQSRQYTENNSKKTVVEIIVNSIENILPKKVSDHVEI